MDMTLLFIAGAVVVLVLGAVFAYRGIKAAAEERDVVPLSEAKEIQSIYNSTNVSLNEEAKAPAKKSASLMNHMMNENLKQTHTTQTSIPASGDMDPQVFELQEENRRLNEALQRELASKNKILDDKELLAEMKAREEEMAKSKALVDNLTDENNKLMQSVESQREALKEVENVAAQYKEELTKSVEDNQAQLKTWDAKLQALADEKTHLFKASEELQNAQHTIEEVKSETQAKLAAANNQVAEIERKLENVDQVQNQQLQKQLNEYTQKLEDLRMENSKLSESSFTNQEKAKKLEEHNSVLLAKEKKLLYELTKARAQNTGLERVCEDFKVQIESMAQAV